MGRVSLEGLVDVVRSRYLQARRQGKTQTLDEFVAIAGYHRKSAIRLLRKGLKPRSQDRRRRPRVYINEVKAALIQVWEVCDRICSKQLAPFLAEMVLELVRTGRETRAPPRGAGAPGAAEPGDHRPATAHPPLPQASVHCQAREPAQREDSSAHLR